MVMHQFPPAQVTHTNIANVRNVGVQTDFNRSDPFLLEAYIKQDAQFTSSGTRQLAKFVEEP